MSSIGVQIVGSFGSLILGIIVGFAFLRWLQKMSSEASSNGVCAICGKDRFVAICERCSKHVCTSDSYRLLLPAHEGLINSPRPARTVCVKCVHTSERDVFKRDQCTVEST